MGMQAPGDGQSKSRHGGKRIGARRRKSLRGTGLPSRNAGQPARLSAAVKAEGER